MSVYLRWAEERWDTKSKMDFDGIKKKHGEV